MCIKSRDELTGKGQCGPCNHLMEHDILVKWNVLVEDGFPHESHHVVRHGDEENGEGKRHNLGSSTGKRHSQAQSLSRSNVLI